MMNESAMTTPPTDSHAGASPAPKQLPLGPPLGMANPSARLLSRVIFAGLLLLLFLVPLPYGTVDPWWEALFECAVFALTGLWFVEWLRSGQQQLLGRADWRLLLPLLALYLYALAQTLPLGGAQPPPLGRFPQTISFDPYETRLVARKLFALTLALALLLRHTNSPRRLRALVSIVIGIGVVCALFGLLRQVSERGTPGFLLPHLRPGMGYAQFINKNHFALLVELTLGLLAGLVVGRGVARQRLLVCGALAVPLWTALILANSRGGILAMLCQVFFLALTYNAGRTRRQPAIGGRRQATATIMRLALAAALLLSLIVGMIWVGGDPLAERLNSVREEVGAGAAATDPSRTGRAAIWQATWRLCQAHPLTGVGLGGYWMAITRYHDGSGELVPQQAHNDYLELWAAGGLIGVALVGWFSYALLSEARRQLTVADSFRRASALGALTGLFGVAVHSLVDFGLHLTGNALICVALVVLATRRMEAAQPLPRPAAATTTGQH